jgi:hypothetical protein
MLTVNGFKFEDDELAAACMELTGNLSDDGMNELFNLIKKSFPKEYNDGLNVMSKEGQRTLMLSHITDCVGDDKVKKFFKLVQDYCTK